MFGWFRKRAEERDRIRRAAEARRYRLEDSRRHPSRSSDDAPYATSALNPSWPGSPLYDHGNASSATSHGSHSHCSDSSSSSSYSDSSSSSSSDSGSSGGGCD